MFMYRLRIEMVLNSTVRWKLEINDNGIDNFSK